MHFVIMGCGRVGARVAMSLDAMGHSVAVIDRTPAAFDRLGDSYSGQKVTGDGFHLTILERAGISDAYAFAAVTDGDNSNIVAARTVHDVYGIDRVVARIYDPERAELYERMGIPTIAAVKRTANAVERQLLPPDTNEVWQDPTGSVSLSKIRPATAWIGRSFGEIERATGTRVSFVSRLSGVLVATDRMALQEHDELYLALPGVDGSLVRKILAGKPSEATK